MRDAIEVRVDSISAEADETNAYELKPVGGGLLPEFTAGSHIDVLLANGLVRSYSLCNPQEERHRYAIAVSRDRNSSGGSEFIHATVRVGDVLRISPPRNNFPLAESARHSVLIAGGIGITPIWCMVQRLTTLDRSWNLRYCARTRRNAAFLGEIENLRSRAPERISFHFDDESGGQLLDIAAIVSKAPVQSHLYCCGPLPMLAAFERATASIPSDRIHLEYFSAKERPARNGGFSVVLGRSGRRIEVLRGSTILQALLDAGVEVAHSCTEGTCGTCETGVLQGIPDHRDSILSEAERAKNETMMICCSGSTSDELVLDL